VLPFATPFLYDPRAGNLLFDFHLLSSSGESLRLDAQTGNPSFRIIGAPSPEAVTALVESAPNVIQLTFQPIPEPSTIALATLSALLLIARKRTLELAPDH
jgi:hypothetical protein